MNDIATQMSNEYEYLKKQNISILKNVSHSMDLNKFKSHEADC